MVSIKVFGNRNESISGNISHTTLIVGKSGDFLKWLEELLRNLGFEERICKGVHVEETTTEEGYEDYVPRNINNLIDVKDSYSDRDVTKKKSSQKEERKIVEVFYSKSRVFLVLDLCSILKERLTSFLVQNTIWDKPKNINKNKTIKSNH